MLRIGIVGASGYSGSELMRILTTHPKKIELACVTSRTYADQDVGRVLPNLRGLVNLKFLELGVKVIDFSADYRLKNAEVYEKWYQEHTSQHLLKEAAYGLPELH